MVLKLVLPTSLQLNHYFKKRRLDQKNCDSDLHELKPKFIGDGGVVGNRRWGVARSVRAAPKW